MDILNTPNENARIKYYKRYVNNNIHIDLDDIYELKQKTNKYYLKIVCATREKMLKCVLVFHKYLKIKDYDKCKEQIILFMKHRKLHLIQLKKLKKLKEDPFEFICFHALAEYMLLLLKYSREN